MRNRVSLPSFLAISVALVLCAFSAPSLAQAEELPSATEESIVLRTPMPYDQTFLTYETARSATTLGLAYIYLKVDAVIDGQYDSPMYIKGAYSYQADASLHFVKWEQLSLDYTHNENSIWAKATGYVYFHNPATMFSDKYYLEIEHTWYL